MIFAAIFDVDGVLTDSAVIHRYAWELLFAELLPDDVAPFGVDDYERFVDGRPRTEGLEAVLHDRRLLDRFTGAELAIAADRKQALFLQALAERGAPPFDDAPPCLHRLRADGYRLAAASSSKNARKLLNAAGLGSAIDLIVDGVDAIRLGLGGKPRPDVFNHAATLLGCEPRKCAVIEDAVSGLTAARRGGFGLVIGLDRSPNRDRGLAAVADIVIDSLQALPFEPA